MVTQCRRHVLSSSPSSSHPLSFVVLGTKGALTFGPSSYVALGQSDPTFRIGKISTYEHFVPVTFRKANHTSCGAKAPQKTHPWSPGKGLGLAVHFAMHLHSPWWRVRLSHRAERSRVEMSSGRNVWVGLSPGLNGR
jgi:hypothetical protein